MGEAQEERDGPGSLYIRAARLITGDGRGVVEDGALRVTGGRITACGPAAEVAPPPGEAVALDFPEGTVLPGLIDAHVHLTMRRGETSVEHARLVSDERALLRGVQAAGQILAAGVTTVRDCGARGTVLQSLREGVREGLVAGPRILASGPPITTTAGHLWALGYEADTAEEARRAVRRLVKEGADFIKVCATGGGMTPGTAIGRAQYGEAELRSVAEDAHRLGRHVAAHAHGTEGLARAVAAGIDTIEHCSWLDASGRGQAFDEAVAREMARRGTFANIASSPPRSMVEGPAPLPAPGALPETAGPRGPHPGGASLGAPAPVARAAGPPPARNEPEGVAEQRATGGGVQQGAVIGRSPTGEAPAERGSRTARDRGRGADRAPTLARWEHARRARELGVPVLFSTDAVYGWWDDGHDLSYLAQALVEAGGFTPLEVIEMITAVPARAIGWGDRLGTLAPGKLADLLVVDGDPARDVRALHRVRAVYREGRRVASGTPIA